MLWVDIENWKRRTQLVEYCTVVVDQSLKEKREALEKCGPWPTKDDPNGSVCWPSEGAGMHLDLGPLWGLLSSVQRNQVHNEMTVETIIRKRAVEGATFMKSPPVCFHWCTYQYFDRDVNILYHRLPTKRRDACGRLLKSSIQITNTIMSCQRGKIPKGFEQQWAFIAEWRLSSHCNGSRWIVI